MGRVIWTNSTPDDPMYKEGYRRQSQEWVHAFQPKASPPHRRRRQWRCPWRADLEQRIARRQEARDISALSS
jgi:hypothetical protein